MNDYSNFVRALNYSFKYYQGLKRKSGGIPYVIHPVRVCSILRAAGYSEFEHETIMISALFHDLIEDTNLTREDIERDFGSTIAQVVSELSKPEQIDKIKWLESFESCSIEAKIIKMADRIDNLLDMIGINWSLERKQKYAEQAKIILKTCGNANLNLAKNLETIIDNILP